MLSGRLPLKPKELSTSLPLPTKLEPGQCVTVPVDVKQNRIYPPTVHCVPIDALSVSDDRATICRGTSPMDKDTYSIHFKSELGGPLGGLDVARRLPDTTAGKEQFSPYALCVNAGRQVYARNILGNKRYNVDLPDRAMLILASALAAAAYNRTDFSLKRVVEGIYAARASLTTLGEDLPAQDRLQAQTQPRMSSYTTAMLEQSEAAANFCRPSSPGHSLFRCIVNGMQDLSGY